MHVRVTVEGSEGRPSRIARVSRGGKVMAGEVRRKKLAQGEVRRVK